MYTVSFVGGHRRGFKWMLSRLYSPVGVFSSESTESVIKREVSLLTGNEDEDEVLEWLQHRFSEKYEERYNNME